MKPEIAVLVETYAAIAATMPQVRIERTDSFIIARAPFAHPLCNFGVILGPEGIGGVLHAASGKPHFNLYTFESQGQMSMPDYVPMLALRIMTAPASEPSFTNVKPAETPGERMQLARFMADQFFSGHRSDTRERIAESTARAEGVSIYGFHAESGPARDDLVGAAMLTHHTSMAGLFNVCVEKSLRGRGWGSAIVRHMLNEAAIRGVATTLQCDLSLEVWYERLGFHAVDTVTVWTVSND